jgi:hypothetical protein
MLISQDIIPDDRLFSLRDLCREIGKEPEFSNKILKYLLNAIQRAGKSIIGEISGHDSIAAIIKRCMNSDIKAVLPVVALTGTEYGHTYFLRKYHTFLRQRLATDNSIEVFDLVFLYDPEFWHLLNGRYIGKIIKRFGFYSPCLGCHLYLHAIRVPLAIKLNIQYIVSGAREWHDKKCKINQHAIALRAYQKLLKNWGIELLFPLQNVKENNEISAIIDDSSIRREDQFRCLLSENYYDTTDAPTVKMEILEEFFEKFGIPTTRKILATLLHNPSANIESIAEFEEF